LNDLKLTNRKIENKKSIEDKVPRQYPRGAGDKVFMESFVERYDYEMKKLMPHFNITSPTLIKFVLEGNFSHNHPLPSSKRAIFRRIRPFLFLHFCLGIILISISDISGHI